MNSKQFIKKYLSRIRKRRKIFHENVKRVSVDELATDIKEIIKKPRVASVASFARDIFGAGKFIGSSYLKYASSYLELSDENHDGIFDQTTQYIVNKVSLQEKINNDSIGDLDIFQAIYRELKYCHHHPEYSTILKTPRIETTVVLVSGVFNELFRTPAFERGMESMSKRYGLKYISPYVHGSKGVRHNVRLLEEQLLEYSIKHPDKKLWLFTYSKGGIDCLHFLKKNREFAERHIIGFSAIASPILGTYHLDNSFFKFIKSDAKRFLNVRYQRPWFAKNYKNLPDIFYTSIGLATNWYNGNVMSMFFKAVLPHKNKNDGLIDVNNARFPGYFDAYNLGTINAHHWVGASSSSFGQEALIQAHIIFLNYIGLLN